MHRRKTVIPPTASVTSFLRFPTKRTCSPWRPPPVALALLLALPFGAAALALGTRAFVRNQSAH